MGEQPRGRHAATSGPHDEQRLEAKEARLRTGQREDLGVLARRLERARPSGHGRRITENTLIRVSVDVLLSVGEDLHGVAEEELLKAAHQLLDGGRPR